jgi:hypothetical protein
MSSNAYGPPKIFSKEDEEKQKLLFELNPGSNPEKTNSSHRRRESESQSETEF